MSSPPRRYRKSDHELAFERDQRIARARLLDRIADCELQAGHHGAAEFLSRQAEDIRLTGGDRLSRRVPR